MGYSHGIYNEEKETLFNIPQKAESNIQIVIGTAPVNLLEKPEGAVNVPIVADSFSDAQHKLGYMEDFERYTICQSIYMAFAEMEAAPIVMINVLDPAKHKTEAEAAQYAVVKYKASVPVSGVLIDSVKVMGTSGEEYVAGTDYMKSFDSNGHLLISIAPDGAAASATAVSIQYSFLDTSKVTAEDIIGGYDIETGKRTGLELLDIVYGKTGIVPENIVIPGYSKNPAVAAVLAGKCKKIEPFYSAHAFVDLDSSSSGADNFRKVKEWKEENGYGTHELFPVWPLVKIKSRKIYGSAYYAALLQKIAADNNGYPADSPDNHKTNITGICTEAGDETLLTMTEANDYLNAYGISTFLFVQDWKTWGSNTGAYPESADPVQRFISNRCMLDTLKNAFSRKFFEKVGRNVSYRNIAIFVNSYNQELNAIQANSYIAGASFSFSEEDNPIENILQGRVKFRTKVAFYPPMECIENEWMYDASILKAELEGESE